MQQILSWGFDTLRYAKDNTFKQCDFRDFPPGCTWMGKGAMLSNTFERRVGCSDDTKYFRYLQS